METIASPLRGIYRDVLIDARGRVLFDSGWASNAIVDGCRVLLAGLMKNRFGEPDEEAAKSGILYLAVGAGRADWDDEPPQPPTPQTYSLETPYDPPVELFEPDFQYLGPSPDAIPQQVPTRRLQVTVTLGNNYPDQDIYALREFGLFGGFEEERYMINCVRHPVIEKHREMTLARRIILEF